MDQDLPIDEGHTAYVARKLLADNPYRDDDWRHKEWELGWKQSEESDPSLCFDWATGGFKNEARKKEL